MGGVLKLCHHTVRRDLSINRYHVSNNSGVVDIDYPEYAPAPPSLEIYTHSHIDICV